MLANSAASLEDVVRDLHYYISGEGSGGGAWNDDVGSSYAEYASRLFSLVKSFSDDRDSVRHIEDSLNSYDEKSVGTMLDNIKRSVDNI